MSLDENITLSSFYKLSNKKIRLNFTAVNTQTDTIEIINYQTKPHMPVWAALVATASLPDFFTSIVQQPEWKRKEESQGYQIVRNFFKNTKKKK